MGGSDPLVLGAGPPKTLPAAPRVAPAHPAPRQLFLYHAIDDSGDDSTVDNGVIIERDTRVDHDDFNPVGKLRITGKTGDLIAFASQHMPATEPEGKSCKNALFAARVDPTYHRRVALRVGAQVLAG